MLTGRAIQHCFATTTLPFFDNKAATDGIKCFADLFSIFKACQKTQSIRMKRQRLGKQEGYISGGIEVYLLLSAEHHLLRLTYTVSHGCYAVHVNRFRVFAAEAKISQQYQYRGLCRF